MGSRTTGRQDQVRGKVPLTLVWVERTTDSTAAGAHLRGTLARLTDSRFRTRIFTEDDAGPRWIPGPGRKLWRILRVVGPARLVRPEGVLLARWSPFIALISRRWLRRGLPTVLFVQGNLDDLYEANPWTRRITRITTMATESIRDANHIVTPSEGLADWAAEYRPDGRAAITVIPNGVDVAMFDRERAVAALGSAPAHVLFFGNMARWQGIDTVLSALEDPRWPADLELWFIGDGQMAGRVQACDDRRVRFLGRLPKSEVARAAALAEITLATRHDDPASATGVSPFKIIESAAAGTPCVVTRVPGQAELAQDIGGSVLIPPDDPQALADAVARLHADPGLRAQLSADGVRGSRAYDWSEGEAALSGIVLALAGNRASGTDRAEATNISPVVEERGTST